MESQKLPESTLQGRIKILCLGKYIVQSAMLLEDSLKLVLPEKVCFGSVGKSGEKQIAILSAMFAPLPCQCKIGPKRDGCLRLWEA